jgi:hypothetical protein
MRSESYIEISTREFVMHINDGLHEPLGVSLPDSGTAGREHSSSAKENACADQAQPQQVPPTGMELLNRCAQFILLFALGATVLGFAIEILVATE